MTAVLFINGQKFIKLLRYIGGKSKVYCDCLCTPTSPIDNLIFTYVCQKLNRLPRLKTSCLKTAFEIPRCIKTRV